MQTQTVLQSWKEIARYMGRTERTLQRWERAFGFPVHRPSGKSRSAVMALSGEIEKWTLERPNLFNVFNIEGHSGISRTERIDPEKRDRTCSPAAIQSGLRLSGQMELDSLSWDRRRVQTVMEANAELRKRLRGQLSKLRENLIFMRLTCLRKSSSTYLPPWRRIG